jgi:ferredoxin-NADP reductase
VGLGFVYTKDWESHKNTLPPVIKASGKEVFSVAVFHQIHCLHYLLDQFNELDDAFHKLQDKLQEKKNLGERTKTGHEGGEEKREHVGHGFDYLRSSLMCCGDTAFEGQASDTTRPSTPGEGSYHVCKNYDMIKKWAETSRVTDMKGYED